MCVCLYYMYKYTSMIIFCLQNIIVYMQHVHALYVHSSVVCTCVYIYRYNTCTCCMYMYYSIYMFIVHLNTPCSRTSKSRNMYIGTNGFVYLLEAANVLPYMHLILTLSQQKFNHLLCMLEETPYLNRCLL